ncbi:hypothetical protein LCGC14_2104110, partial [marine sediment metagenome]
GDGRPTSHAFMRTSTYSNVDEERFNRLAVGREQRMIELKREVNEMARKAGVAPPYDSALVTGERGDPGVRQA